MTDLLEAFRTHLAMDAIAIRLTAASVLGFCIGLDREFRDRPAGLRTHMMTSLAAAMFGLIALEMIAAFDEDDTLRLDPIRIVEAVTAGVGFLAAGTIIQRRGEITGLTTGASMWLAGAVGLACGTGFLKIALLGVFFALAILIPMRMIEKNVLHSRDSGSSRKDIKDEPDQMACRPKSDSGEKHGR